MKIYNFVLVNKKCYLYGREMLILQYKFNGRLVLDHIFELRHQQGDIIVADPENVRCKVIQCTTGAKEYIIFFPKVLGI